MTFFKLVEKLKKENSHLKLVCVGLDNAGKTTILQNIFNKQTCNIHPTFGYSLYSCTYNDISLLVYDVGGQSIFREYWDNYFEKCDGLIFVYDLTTQDDSCLEKILCTVPDVPVLILGNKRDLIEKAKDVVKYSENVRIYNVSGVEYESLVEPFDWFITKCKDN
ncbi:ADP-ribosylation factor-like protein 2 [Vairimorpha necatrix]|uniref:ADP-ribosylation factor-like protein 2 n=1 Tax=Vairimorpha necatrix TaxID=6039 RepID=A0AAX4JFY6_9MICR